MWGRCPSRAEIKTDLDGAKYHVAGFTREDASSREVAAGSNLWDQNSQTLLRQVKSDVGDPLMAAVFKPEESPEEKRRLLKEKSAQEGQQLTSYIGSVLSRHVQGVRVEGFCDTTGSRHRLVQTHLHPRNLQF